MILVVDDDKNIRLSLKLILERNGYEVALAEGPKEAMQIVRNTPAVELVLLDMNFWSSELALKPKKVKNPTLQHKNHKNAMAKHKLPLSEEP